MRLNTWSHGSTIWNNNPLAARPQHNPWFCPETRRVSGTGDQAFRIRWSLKKAKAIKRRKAKQSGE